MTDMTMRERVARAICEAGYDMPEDQHVVDSVWANWLSEADAAIAAMAEGLKPVAWRCRRKHWPTHEWVYLHVDPRTGYDIVEPLYAISAAQAETKP